MSLQDRRNKIAAELTYNEDKTELLRNGKTFAVLHNEFGWDCFYKCIGKDYGYGEIHNTGLQFFANEEAFCIAAEGE